MKKKGKLCKAFEISRGIEGSQKNYLPKVLYGRCEYSLDIHMVSNFVSLEYENRKLH